MRLWERMGSKGDRPTLRGPTPISKLQTSVSIAPWLDICGFDLAQTKLSLIF
jgi:hypothetical protein